MKITNAELLMLNETMKKCNGLGGSKVAYAVYKNQAIVERENELLQKMHLDVVSKYKDPDRSDENRIQVKEEFLQEANKELTDLYNQEADVDFYQIKPGDFNPEKLILGGMTVDICRTIEKYFVAKDDGENDK